jgi:hypothetical protein
LPISSPAASGRSSCPVFPVFVKWRLDLASFRPAFKERPGNRCTYVGPSSSSLREPLLGLLLRVRPRKETRMGVGQATSLYPLPIIGGRVNQSTLGHRSNLSTPRNREFRGPDIGRLKYSRSGCDPLIRRLLELVETLISQRIQGDDELLNRAVFWSLRPDSS